MIFSLLIYLTAWSGTYWIIALGSSYQYSVVTSKGGSALYILSRTPSMDPAVYAEAVRVAEAQGIAISKLELTVQNGCRYPN